MLKSLSNIHPIKPDRSVVFFSPLEGEDILVRTGVHNEYSFYRSILNSTYNGFVKFSYEKQNSIIENFIKKMCSIDIKKSKKFRSIYFDNVVFTFKNIYSFINEEPDVKGKITGEILRQIIKSDTEYQYYKFIVKLLPLEIISKTIVSDEYDFNLEKVVKDIIEYFSSIDEIKSLSKRKLSAFQELLENMFISSLKIVYTHSKDEFQNYYIENDIMDKDMFSKISKFSKRDIYVIDSKNRYPLKDYKELLQKTKSVILMKIEGNKGNHYEQVGILMRKDSIKRNFRPSDDIIVSLYNYITGQNCYVKIEQNKKSKYSKEDEYMIKNDIYSNLDNIKQEKSDFDDFNEFNEDYNEEIDKSLNEEDSTGENYENEDVEDKDKDKDENEDVEDEDDEYYIVESDNENESKDINKKNINIY